MRIRPSYRMRLDGTDGYIELASSLSASRGPTVRSCWWTGSADRSPSLSAHARGLLRTKPPAVPRETRWPVASDQKATRSGTSSRRK